MDNASDPALIVLILGVAIFLSMLLKAFLDRTSVPTLVGYIALGLGLRLAEKEWSLLGAGGEEVFRFLGDAGLVVLLFRVGLESNLRRLMSQFGRASLVAVGDICLAAFVAFATCRWILNMNLAQSVIVSAGLTATSVGVAVSLWQASGALNTGTGALLVDVAEMDDIAGVVILGLVLALAPDLHSGHVALESLGTVVGISLLRLSLFVGLCLVFAHYLESPLLRFLKRWEIADDMALTVAAFGFIMAALASLLGFSLAIGAFFAGLMFSRDPKALGLEKNFGPIHELLSPFFFIGIGMGVDPSALSAAGGATLVLFGAAVLGKIAGNGAPVYMLEGSKPALLVGVSMVPRAEVTMIVMQMGQGLGDWAVTDEIFAAVVLSSILTCVVGALAVKVLLDKVDLPSRAVGPEGGGHVR